MGFVVIIRAETPSKAQLVTYVRRFEAQPVIEAMRVWPGFIGRKLHQRASARATLCDRPLEHCVTDPFAPPVACYAHGFNLPAFCAAPRQSWNKRELQGADDLTAVFDHT